MSLLHAFQQFIAKENLFSPKETLLLAVSGGVDSVVLCELCTQAGYDFIIAHCNFQLRGEESDKDENLVRQLGLKYGKQVLVKHFNTAQYAASNKVSIQVAARELRYNWFFSIVNNPASEVDSRESGVVTQLRLPTKILTAHHADDNIETLLMNFFKGTGIAGLRGILPKQGKIVRPLLFAKKESIRQFAAENNVTWVEDSSNQSDKYTRNYFRNQLIPLVKNSYPEAENNLVQNLERFREIELLYRQSIDQHKKKLLEQKGNEVHIPVLKLKKTVPLHSIVYEIIKEYQFSPQQTAEAIALLDSETGKYIQSASHRIIKNRNWLIISPVKSMEADTIIIDETDKLIVFEQGTLEFLQTANAPRLPEDSISNSVDHAFLDAATIKFPLLLRRWKTGDYFYPLGMKKKKKLARFFIDRKLSKTAKEKTWVLESDKKIAWVIGQRIDDRCRITPATKMVVQVRLKALNV